MSDWRHFILYFLYKMEKRISLKISGLVQGVFFRAQTKKYARSLGLLGLVRNLDDGRVEIVAEGEEPALKELQKWAEKGPDLAQVENVESKLEAPTGEFSDFKVE